MFSPFENAFARNRFHLRLLSFDGSLTSSHLFLRDRNRQKTDRQTDRPIRGQCNVSSQCVNLEVKPQPHESFHILNSCTCSLWGQYCFSSPSVHQICSPPPPSVMVLYSLPIQGGGVQAPKPVGHEIGARFDRLFPWEYRIQAKCNKPRRSTNLRNSHLQPRHSALPVLLCNA